MILIGAAFDESMFSPFTLFQDNGTAFESASIQEIDNACTFCPGAKL